MLLGMLNVTRKSSSPFLTPRGVTPLVSASAFVRTRRRFLDAQPGSVALPARGRIPIDLSNADRADAIGPVCLPSWTLLFTTVVARTQVCRHEDNGGHAALLVDAEPEQLNGFGVAHELKRLAGCKKQFLQQEFVGRSVVLLLAVLRPSTAEDFAPPRVRQFGLAKQHKSATLGGAVAAKLLHDGGNFGQLRPAWCCSSLPLGVSRGGGRRDPGQRRRCDTFCGGRRGMGATGKLSLQIVERVPQVSGKVLGLGLGLGAD